jgi:hypothetical protein
VKKKKNAKRSLSVAVCCCWSYIAVAQVGSGTVVAYENLLDRFVIAADSRAVFDDRPPADDRCKIAVFGKQVIFATSGAAEFRGVPAGPAREVGPWNNIEEARSAIGEVENNPREKTSDDSEIADAWARRLKTKWDALLITSPELVRAASEIGKGLITTGIFADNRHGTIALVVREVRLTNNSIEIAVFNCPAAHWCVSGTAASLWQINAAQPLVPSPGLLKEYDFALLQIYRLADLVVAYQPLIQTIRGPVQGVWAVRSMPWKCGGMGR